MGSSETAMTSIFKVKDSNLQLQMAQSMPCTFPMVITSYYLYYVNHVGINTSIISILGHRLFIFHSSLRHRYSNQESSLDNYQFIRLDNLTQSDTSQIAVPDSVQLFINIYLFHIQNFDSNNLIKKKNYHRQYIHEADSILIIFFCREIKNLLTAWIFINE